MVLSWADATPLANSQPQAEVSLGQDHRPGPPVPPRQRTQPRGQLEQAERLDQVVVRPGVEPADPVADAVPGRQH